MRVHVSPEYLGRPVEFVAAHYVPQIVAAGMAFSRATYEHSRLSGREFEAARVRVAQINGCALCQSWRSAVDAPLFVSAQGGNIDSLARQYREPPGEEFYAAIADWRASLEFSGRERIAIEYAERLCRDPRDLALDDRFWGRAKAAFSDAEIVDLSYCVAAWMGLGRVAHALGIDGVCQLPSRTPNTLP